MAKSRIIDITPDRSLLPKLGTGGYSAPQALAELVDNSIDARRPRRKLRVAIKIARDTMEVIDDGSGMDGRTIGKSLVLAWSEKEGKLGEFGLGMKTACLSLGERFEVRSTTGTGREFRIAYDPVKWMGRGKAWRIPMDEVRCKRDKVGTTIIVRDVKLWYPRLATVVRNDLERRFAPFLRSKQVEITVNGRRCKAEEIQLLPRSKREFELKMKDGNVIHGWYGLLAEGSSKGYYGFHTYRRNRMITTFDKLVIGEDPTLSRVIGEIHLDGVPVTHNKREFIRDSRIYREATKLLERAFHRLVREARKQARLDTVTATVRREVQSWQRKITDVLQGDEFRRFASRIPKLARTVGVPSGRSGRVSSRKKKKKATAAKKPPRGTVHVGGRFIGLKHHFAPLGTNAGRRQASLSKTAGLEVYTNTDFPAYAATKDKVFYAVMNVSESVAEMLVRESGEDPRLVEEIKDLILRQAAELKLGLA